MLGAPISGGACALTLLVGASEVPSPKPMLDWAHALPQHLYQHCCTPIVVFADAAATSLPQSVGVEALFELETAGTLTFVVRVGPRSRAAQLAGLLGVDVAMSSALLTRTVLAPAAFQTMCSRANMLHSLFGWLATSTSERPGYAYYLQRVTLPPINSALMSPSAGAASEPLRTY